MRRILFGLALLVALGVFASLPTRDTRAQTPPAPTGGAWFANFYNNPDLSGDPVATGIQYPSGINQNWDEGKPSDGSGVIIEAVNADNFSARFTTSVQFTAGLYEFVVVADDGARLSINGSTVIDFYGNVGAGQQNTVRSLGSGPFTLVVEYVDRTGPAFLSVQWFASTGTPQATASPQPIAQGEVEQVRGLAVRTGPFLGASLVAVARQENTYPIIARNDREGLFTWYRIQLNEEIVGWSSGRYLAVTTGDVNLIPFEDTVFSSIPDGLQDRGIVGVTRAVMNFRVYPSERAQRIGQLPWGAEVPILARTVQGGQNFWLYVAYTFEDTDVTRYGWIYAPFVGVRGPIEAVPVL